MPYFGWKGIQLDGTECEGSLFAPSLEILDSLLLKKGIALLQTRKKPLFRFLYPVSHTAVIRLFDQLQVLLVTGIRLPQILVMLAQQEPNPRLQEMLFFAAQEIDRGASLYTAFEHYPQFFDSVVCHQLRVGEEVGRLVHAAASVKLYLERKSAFYSQLRSLLTMPGVTLIFLIAIALIIFGAIMPQFTTIFIMLGHDMPPLTQAMIRVSASVRSWYFPAVIALVCLTIRVLFIAMRSHKVKHLIDKFLLWCTFSAGIVRYSILIQCYTSLALLLQEGVTLDCAIQVVRSTTANTVFFKALGQVCEDVDAGLSLAEALARHPQLFSSDGIAVIAIGQEAHALPVMLQAVATDYQKKLDAALHRLAGFAQPFFLLVLGLLIGLLIIAVYTPIMQVAYKI